MPEFNDLSEQTNEILVSCSEQFPAVFDTVGPDYWHLMKKSYRTLSLSSYREVKLPLARGFYIVASVLGSDIC